MIRANLGSGSHIDILLLFPLLEARLCGVCQPLYKKAQRVAPMPTHQHHGFTHTWPGWHLIGAYPDGDPGDVGSWILAHDGDAMLLEVPPGLTVREVRAALRAVGATLRYVAASHDHEDHLDVETWERLVNAFRGVEFIHPASVLGDRELSLAGEPLWLVKGPKHSATDVVTVFRGVAMTGDIELGMLASVNDEVPWPTKMRSMDRLRGFPARAGYQVHTIVSAHLNDVRESIEWPDLFRYDDALRKRCRRCGGSLMVMERDPAGFDRRCEDCRRTEWSDPRKK